MENEDDFFVEAQVTKMLFNDYPISVGKLVTGHPYLMVRRYG